MGTETSRSRVGSRACAQDTAAAGVVGNAEAWQSAAANSEAFLANMLERPEEVMPTRAGHGPVAIVSLADYGSLKEPAYLLQNRANARRLLTSITRLDYGRGRARKLTN